MTSPGDNITLVSGYWPIHSKHDKQAYDTWMRSTLCINQRMYFFCDKESEAFIKECRGDRETIFIEHSIQNFHSRLFYNNQWRENYEIPSSDLGKIWHEKLNLLKIAKDLDRENATDFYVWYDAGCCLFRDNRPPQQRLNLSNIHAIPKDRVCYSSSYPPQPHHEVSGTVLVLHKDLINDVHHLFYNCVKEHRHHASTWYYGSDQVIFTMLMKRYPHMFYKIADGYGNNLMELYNL
jgi:hypothetical protein